MASYLETAIDKDGRGVVSGSAERRYHLAMAYTRVGDKRGPEMLRAAMRAAPDLPEAEMAQRMLAEKPRRVN